MVRISILFFGAFVAVGACTAVHAKDERAKEVKTAKKAASEPYEGFKADQVLLRKQLVHMAKDGGKGTRASSAEACHAAQRIFSRVSFLFRTRKDVLDLLGDPATISDYSEPAGKDPSSALVYVFDTGFGGLKYSISFSQGDPAWVTGVEVQPGE